MGEQLPFFSIIIPTYARPERLEACLKSLTCLDYSRDRFEVIVVDDGSKVPPDKVVTAYDPHLNIRLIIQSHAGPATARNTGAKVAKGEFLAFTDDDCEPDAKWLQNLAIRFLKDPNYAIGGHTLNGLSNNSYSTASELLMDYLHSIYNSNPKQANFFTSNNLALPASYFNNVGGFDTSFPLAAGEDRELCDRLVFQGYQVIYAPEVLVYHFHKLTWRSFWKQHFNYGCGAFHFHQMRSQRSQEQIKLERLSFYWDLLRYPFSKEQSWRSLLMSFLFIISQVATTAGFFWKKTR